MLTIEQLPVAIKDRVVELINRHGMNATTVRSCCYGLAYANSGANGMAEAIKNLGSISDDYDKNRREYLRQVMTIYGTHMSGVMMDEFQLAGIEMPQDSMQEWRLSSEKIIANTVEDHLDALEKELDNIR